MQERMRKVSQGGLEDDYPEVIQMLQEAENQAEIALNAGLTLGQWQAVSLYLEHPSIKEVANGLGKPRSGVYARLYTGFAKLNRFERLKREGLK